MSATAKYETTVYPRNLHSGHGIPVVVYATTKQEAINKAVAIGWKGHASDARCKVNRVEEVPPSPVPEPQDYGQGGDRA